MSHTTHSIAFSTDEPSRLLFPTWFQDFHIIALKSPVNWCSRKKVKGIESICYFGTLTYNPERCSNCGKTSANFNIIKYGVKTSRITLNRTDNHPTFLFLKKQRYYCKHCQTKLSAQTNLVKEHCFISKNVIQCILVEGQSILSEKDIAKRFRVSTTTVSRALHQWQEQFRPSYQSLPQHLSIDEFKSGKSADSQMSFIFSDSTTHKIIDILPSRRLTVLKDYFSSYSRTARNAVKTVVVDMNAPYYVLVKELFPKAKLIVDRFHLSQLIVRSLSQTRIQLMNRFKTSCPENQKTYRKLKRYWKLVLKKETELSDTSYRYTPLFKCMMTSRGIIDYLTNLDESFKATYRLVQQLTVAFDHRNFEAYNTLIHQKHSSVSHYLKKSLRTLRKYAHAINNSFIYRYSTKINRMNDAKFLTKLPSHTNLVSK